MKAWTRDVIAQLIEEGSWTARAKAIEHIAERLMTGSLSEAECCSVTEALRIVLYDSEPLVRRVLADSVKLASGLPRDIVLALAQDVAEVAAPLLEASPLLTEEDLLLVARTGSTLHRVAIAGRSVLSSRLADLLCRRSERAVVCRVLANDGAAIPEATLHWLLDHADDHPYVVDAIARRRLLPVGVGARLAMPGTGSTLPNARTAIP